jgi:hypothetical protein
LGAAATAVRPAPQAARAAANNGTCLSRLEPFGYKCEEHTVRIKRQNNDVRHTVLARRLINSYYFSIRGQLARLPTSTVVH